MERPRRRAMEGVARAEPRPARVRRARAGAAFLAALVASGAGGCSSGAAPGQGGTALHAAEQRGAAGSPGALAVSAIGAFEAEWIRGGRTPLGEAVIEPLEYAIEPGLDGGAAIFVAKRSSDQVGWVRSVDAAGERGPVLRLDGEDLYGALSPPGGGTTLLTSRGGRLCVVTFRRGEATAASRACGATSARGIAAVGERLALVEVEEVASLAPPAAKGRKAPGGGAGDAKKAAPKKKKGGAKAGAGKRRQGGAARGGKGKAGKARAAPPAPRPEVEVLIRWVSPEGVFDGTARPTGLRFRPPLEGMTVIDAIGRSGAIDVLHYDGAPKRRTNAPTMRAPLGGARIVGASLDAEGRLEPTRRAFVAEGDLEYGFLRGHEQPRLFATAAGSAYVGSVGRGGPCEAARFAPSFERFAGAPCEVAPWRLTSLAPLTPGEVSALERIRESGARRAPLQPAHDGAVAAWAGDRAYYQVAGDLFSAARDDGTPRREEAPFPARRARIAWGAFAVDGEGIAWAGSQLRRVGAAGEVAAAGGPVIAARPADRRGAGAPAGAPVAPPVVPGEADAPADRRRAARIGATWWLARGDVVRLLPSRLPVPELRGRAHPDGAALVGGRERGLFLEVLAGRLRLTGVDPGGALTPLGAPAPSPVRPGFDACERRAGGALVAGVSASSPRRVIALAIDEGGRVGPARETSLPVAAGDFALRLVALPGGGALLTDLGRQHVAWLSDDGAELAARPWPAIDTGARCVDGRPAPLEVPAPAPGVFVRVPELAAPGACVVGDLAWAADGSLRWFGSTEAGLDAQAEAGVARPALPVAAALPADPAPVAPSPAPASPAAAAALPPVDPAPACPSDMVAIDGGRFCIDRFEATLVDGETGETLSPDYPPTPNLLEFTLAEWAMGRQRIGDVHARAMPLPLLPAWQRGKKIAAVARPRFGGRPSGYVSGLVAESACAAAGRRLCSPDEFLVACRGEDDTLFPYGDAYEDGACNVSRGGHPAAILHGNASMGHLDPRLNRVRLDGEPLLREAGATPRCRSRWGADAVHDLVGNLDEWVEEPGGAFAGGFYSRSTRAGCEALVTAHPRTYADYSTGVRCCLGGASAASPLPAR